MPRRAPRRRRRSTGDTPGIDSGAVERRYDLHGPGFLYVGVTVFIAIGAFNSQNNLLFWAFGLAVAGLVVSGMASGAALMGVRVHRIVPDEVSAGEGLRVRYRVRNTARWFPAFALVVHEVGRDAAEEKKQRRWQAAISRPVAFVAHCGPGESVVAEADVLARARGLTNLRDIVVTTTFPFGLIRKSLYFRQPAPIVVLPPELDLRPDLIRRAVAGRDPSWMTSAHVGTGEEFFGIREYTPGDSRRSIAWKRTAQADELLVRQGTAPTPVRIRVEVDRPPEGTIHETYEAALALAATVATRAEQAGYPVGLRADWAEIDLQPRPGRRWVAVLRHRLAMLPAVSDLPLTGQDEPPGDGARARTDAATVRIGFGPGPSGRAGVHLDASEPAVWLDPASDLPEALHPGFARPAQAARRRWAPTLRLFHGRQEGTA